MFSSSFSAFPSSNINANSRGGAQKAPTSTSIDRFQLSPEISPTSPQQNADNYCRKSMNANRTPVRSSSAPFGTASSPSNMRPPSSSSSSSSTIPSFNIPAPDIPRPQTRTSRGRDDRASSRIGGDDDSDEGGDEDGGGKKYRRAAAESSTIDNNGVYGGNGFSNEMRAQRAGLGIDNDDAEEEGSMINDGTTLAFNPINGNKEGRHATAHGAGTPARSSPNSHRDGPRKEVVDEEEEEDEEDDDHEDEKSTATGRSTEKKKRKAPNSNPGFCIACRWKRRPVCDGGNPCEQCKKAWNNTNLYDTTWPCEYDPDFRMAKGQLMPDIYLDKRMRERRRIQQALIDNPTSSSATLKPQGKKAATTSTPKPKTAPASSTPASTTTPKTIVPASSTTTVATPQASDITSVRALIGIMKRKRDEFESSADSFQGDMVRRKFSDRASRIETNLRSKTLQRFLDQESQIEELLADEEGESRDEMLKINLMDCLGDRKWLG